MKQVFHFCSVLFIMFLSTQAYGQVNSQKRIEFDSKDGFSDEEIHVFGSKGFIMSSRSEEKQDGMSKWNYELYNTDLQSVKLKNIKIDSKFSSDKTFRNDKGLFVFYRDKKSNFKLVSVQADELVIKQANGMLPNKTYVNDMVVLGEYAFLDASIKKKPFLISVNCKTGKTNLIPIVIGDYSAKKTYTQRMQVLESSGEILVYVEVMVKKSKNEIYVVQMNDKGKKTGMFHFTEGISENIIDISGSSVGEGSYVFTGTYSRSAMSSEGIFFSRVDNNKVDFINFVKFLDMKNFLSYLPKREQDKIEKKIKKKEKKGKELTLSYRIADHAVIPSDDGFLFLGEAFYPTYRQESYTTTSTVNGVSTTTTQYRTVFDGYQYTHAVLAKFNAQGELLWNQTFAMWPSYKPYFVKRFISLAEQSEDNIKMVFASYNRIVSKTISLDGVVIQENKSEEIETGYSGDKAKYSYSNIDFWYDQFFIAYGNQVIKNKEDKSVKRKRKVFFISRIEY
jgi:hypothetical protein